MTLFGFETEVVAGAGDLVEHLNAHGLTNTTRLHAYHCRCSETCEATPDRPHLFHCQEDCTVDGEFITKPLLWGSDEAERAFTGLSQGLIATRAQPGSAAGNHVHVERKALRCITNEMALLRLFARYEREELEQLARGSSDAVRGYNAKTQFYGRNANGFWDVSRRQFSQKLGKATYKHLHGVLPMPEGSSLAWKGQTVEFRLWNSTRAEWRLRLYVGLSVAMVHAAASGVWVTKDDPRSFLDVVGPHMTAETRKFYDRQMAA